MSVIFKNPGLIDVAAMITSGVSAKVGDNPIGIFGTGIKYAIAILLRNGCGVTVYRGSKPYVFGTRKKTIRGKEFKLVTMNGKDVNFTDRLGLNWEMWQAYRELWSNCRDENGTVYAIDSTDGTILPAAQAQRGTTTIVVTGKEFERCYNDRHQIILASQPMTVLPGMEVHPGENNHIYYKGIRVYKLVKNTMFTYNITDNQMLTEDRTLLYPSLLPGKIARGIVQATWLPFLEDVLNSKRVKDHMEANLPFDQARDTKPTPQFMDVAERMYVEKTLTPGASSLFKKYQDTMPGYKSPFIVTLSESDNAIFDEAHALVLKAIPSPGFEGTRIEFKSSMETHRVTAGKKLITIDYGIVKKGKFELAKALLEGLVMTKGGSFTEQFTTFILTGDWVPEELAKTPDQRYMDDSIPF